jgi:hypothetical protein
MARSVSRLGIPALLALASIAAPARAEPAGRLAYERGSGAESCPDEVALRRAVAARLGEDPFGPGVSRTFRLVLGSTGARLRGSVELVTDGVTEGRRELEADADACPELVEAMALAVSLTINPNLVVDGAPPRSEPEKHDPAPAPPPSPEVALASPSPSPSPVRDTPSLTPAARAASTAVTLATGAFAHGAVGTGPGIAAGGSVVVRVGAAWWHVGLEGRVDALSQAGIGRNGTVHSTLLAGVLAPCVRLGPASGCPVLLLGSLLARSRGVTTERSDRGFYAAGGGRLAAGAPLGKRLVLEARLDALYPFTPVTIDLDGTPVWRAKASGALGVGVIGEFP